MSETLSRTHVLPFGTEPGLRRGFQVVDEDLPGNMRFGKFLEVLDKVAEEVGLTYVRAHHPEARVVTAAVDHIQLLAPADITRDVVLKARLNFVGRTSMEVGIRVEQPAGAQGEPATHLASCYFTMVARRADGTAGLPVPAFEPADALARERWAKALERREEHRRALTAAQAPPSHEEFALLAGLHAAQEAPDFQGLLARELRTSGWERTYPEQENVPRKIFGGYLIRKAYEQSSICAELAAPDRAVIGSVNRINFNQPVRMGDKLRFESRVVYSGGCSLCVETDIFRVSRDRRQTALSNTCAFTFVNVGQALEPRPVPGVHPTDYREDAAFLFARRRHRSYLSWKTRGKP